VGAALALFLVLSIAPVCGQTPKDPTKLLGLTLAQFGQIYPKDCKKLRPAAFADENKAGSLGACTVKHHAKELFPGSRIAQQVAFFKGQFLIEVDFYIKGAPATLGLTDLYGAHDAPIEMGSSYSFGTAVYGGSDRATTLDAGGESKIEFRDWTRSAFRIQWVSSAHMDWDEVADGPSLLPRGERVEKVCFIARSVPVS
jgi:hypothetical protein